MALNGSAFKGRCALFSTGYWRTEDRAELTGQPGDVSHLVVQQWGPPAACQFATFVGIFTVLYGAAQGWRCLFYLHGRHDDVILSLGLFSWCDTVTDDNTRPYSCAESQSVPLYLDVDTSSFYTELSLAQASLWGGRLSGWLSPSWPSFGSTTPTARTSVALSSQREGAAAWTQYISQQLPYASTSSSNTHYLNN
ncbi:hypothetical protein INR49_014593 [Caranx melampygus]|nr:hypothetical protein INR49_014593 [Caranx melampygus]